MKQRPTRRSSAGQVGNYAEIYERSVGAQSPQRFARGINALWDDGGVMVPMPLR